MNLLKVTMVGSSHILTSGNSKQVLFLGQCAFGIPLITGQHVHIHTEDGMEQWSCCFSTSGRAMNGVKMLL